MRVAIAVLLVVALAALAGAQLAAERFIGTVPWISGTRMALALDNGPSVLIDLNDADQGVYQSLRPGDRVVVTGTVPPERDRVIASSVESASN